MSKQWKILLGIVTILPLLYMFVFMGFFILTFVTLFQGGSPPEAVPMFSHFFTFFGLHLFTMFMMMGLTVFYIVNVFRNERVQENRKTLWAVVIFLGNIIAMPIYWYLYIWSEPKPLPQVAPTAG